MHQKHFTLLLVVIVISIKSFAATKIGDLYYNLDASNLTAEVTYQSYFDENNNYPGLIAANIPTVVTSNNVTYSVTRIGNYAFVFCTDLTSIEIPSSVTSIGNEAFGSCSSLTSVTIPNSVTRIGEYAFIGCSGLSSINVAENNTVYSSMEGVLFDKNMTQLIQFPSGNSIVLYEIPNSVTSIGNYAFSGCYGITSIEIPHSVTNIGERAFSNCSALTSIEIPNSVTSIKYRAFYNVPNIVYYGAATGSPWGARSINGYVDGYLVYRDDSKTSLLACSTVATGEIAIPNSVTSIGDNAFYGCTALTSIEIPNSVTSFGDYSFSGCTGLTSVDVPNSVTKIGNYAFSGCFGLTSLNIGKSVTSIGSCAFKDCEALQDVTINSNSIVSKTYTYGSNLKNIFGTQVTKYIIGDSVTSIGNYSFYGCTSLTSIEIHNSVTSIGNYAFANCTGLISIEIPNSVTSIGNYAFANCTGLISIEIPNSVTSIGSCAIYGCSALTSIAIGTSVTTIGSSAFSGCSSLTSVKLNSNSIVGTSYTSSSSIKDIFGNQVKEYILGDSIKSIGYEAFSGCSALTSVTIGNNVTNIGLFAFANCAGLTSVTIPDGVTSIGSWAFYNCTGLTSVTIPSSVTSISNYEFEGCNNIKNIYFTGSIDEWCNKSWSPVSISSSYDLYIQGLKIDNLVIPDNVLSINNGAFYNCTGLTSVTIPGSVTSIGKSAFYGCSGLQSISIENGVKSIESSAFSGCTALTSITIPNSITSIGSWAFYNCTDLTSVTIPSSVTSIGGAAFGDCNTLTTVVLNSNSIVSKTYTSSSSIRGIFGDQVTEYILGNSIKSIGDYAFYNCTGLTSVTIPKNVQNFGEAAFYKCSNLNTVNAYSIEHWCSLSFKDYSSNPLSCAHNLYINGDLVENLVIPEGVTSIGDYAFDNAFCLQSVTFSESVTTFGQSAFYGCSGLTSLTIPNSVKKIKSSTFCNCTGLLSVTISNGVKSIEDYAFSNCTGLNFVNIPNGVTSIGERAFSQCSGLRSVNIPNSVTSIGDGVFYGCSKLTDIFVVCGDLERIKQLLQNDSRVKYAPLPYTIKIYAEHGHVDYPQNICEPLTATPDYGYHFVQWSDGITDNPRTIELTQDTTFTAEFSPNQYNINVTCDELYGSIEGESGEYDYLTEKSYEAIPNYGYHFVRWSDGNSQNPRIVTITQDISLNAVFAKNIYTIIDNSNHTQGYIDGSGTSEYLDEIMLTPVNEYGYHFTQWSDGVTDNPRTIILTQDTTFTAEFAIDKSGTCGKDNALTWSYDDKAKELTISGNNTLDDNYTYGVEAPTQMRKLILDNEISVIGEGAFYGCNRLMIVYLGEAIETIGDNAFRNCPYILEIHAPMEFPPIINESVFAECGDLGGIDCYVTEESFALYKKTNVWKEFNLLVEAVPTHIDNTSADQLKATKILRDGQILILRGEKVYTVTGQEVK